MYNDENFEDKGGDAVDLIGSDGDVQQSGGAREIVDGSGEVAVQSADGDVWVGRGSMIGWRCGGNSPKRLKLKRLRPQKA